MRYAAVVVLLVVLALLCACEDENGEDMAAAVTITEEDFGDTVGAKVGDTIDIALKANATTGYQWTCTWQPRAWLKLLGDEYVADQAPSGMVGTGGVQHFVLEAMHAGEARITLQYGRQWEGGEREEPQTVMLEIAE